MPEDVRSRFAPVAANYTTAAYHTDPALLADVVELGQVSASDHVLDVATGTGNTAFAFAGIAHRVIGLDLTRAMLEQARRIATERAITNVDWVEGDVAAMPLSTASFDLVSARVAPHHFADVASFLAECRRVLRPGGRLVLVDCAPPELVRDALHELESLRDPSHVRCRTTEEWVEIIAGSGFDVEVAESHEMPWDYTDWMSRMGVGEDRAEELASKIERAPEPARALLRPERRNGRLWHAYWHAHIRARR